MCSGNENRIIRKSELDIFKLPYEPFGEGDTERCIEIPWAMSVYSGETQVLDVGYANAEDRYIEQILSLNIPELHGTDIVEKKVEGFIKHVGDIRETAFPNDFFDLVYCISTIEHIGRDNTIYDNKYCENDELGDIRALKEIYRITKNGGRIVLTVPFGKYHNYGWFIHYDGKRWNQLLSCVNVKIIREDFFVYKDGWKNCDKADLKDVLYQENNAPAASGLVCVLLEKVDFRVENNGCLLNENIGGNMNTFEIRDDEIGVEEVDYKTVIKIINMNVRNRNEINSPPEIGQGVSYSNCMGCVYPINDAIFESIENANINCSIQNTAYSISSHRPFIGRFLVKARELVNGEVKRYIDPIIIKQESCNKNTIQALRLIITETNEKIKYFDENITELKMQIRALGEQKEIYKKEIEVLRESIENQKDICGQITKSNLHTPDLAINYFRFNEIFGGSEAEIRSVYTQFIHFFTDCTNVLDIGSGRGIFLDLLKENGIKSYGIDLNDDLIEYCTRKGLDVKKDEAYVHLANLEDNSLDGIFMAHVIEHLPKQEMVNLIKLFFEKLKANSYIVIALPNILTVSVSSNTFYLDPTHINHLHPEVLKFLLRENGFGDIQERFYQPFPAESKLRQAGCVKGKNETYLEDINYNFNLLNQVLFGYRDYAVIAKK